MKKLFLTTGIFLFVFIAVYIFSPYRDHALYSKPAIVNSIEINAPVQSVYTYLGNSDNASRWSVFVKKIVPLNSETVPDGAPGSLRRCFTETDSTAMIWDEEIIYVEPNVKRTLTTFNLRNFPITVNGLQTDQLYETLANDRCRLSFTLYFKNEPPLWEKIKLTLTSYYISYVFSRNLENIKHFTEINKKN
jgi:hypothetical protein